MVFVCQRLHFRVDERRLIRCEARPARYQVVRVLFALVACIFFLSSKKIKGIHSGMLLALIDDSQ